MIHQALLGGFQGLSLTEHLTLQGRDLLSLLCNPPNQPEHMPCRTSVTAGQLSLSLPRYCARSGRATPTLT